MLGLGKGGTVWEEDMSLGLGKGVELLGLGKVSEVRFLNKS